MEYFHISFSELRININQPEAIVEKQFQWASFIFFISLELNVFYYK